MRGARRGGVLWPIPYLPNRGLLTPSAKTRSYRMRLQMPNFLGCVGGGTDMAIPLSFNI